MQKYEKIANKIPVCNKYKNYFEFIDFRTF